MKLFALPLIVIIAAAIVEVAVAAFNDLVLETKTLNGRLEYVAMDYMKAGKQFTFCALLPHNARQLNEESLIVIDNLHKHQCHNSVSLQLQIDVHGRPQGDKRPSEEEQRAYVHPAGATHSAEPMNYVHASVRRVVSVENTPITDLYDANANEPEHHHLKRQFLAVGQVSLRKKEETLAMRAAEKSKRRNLRSNGRKLASTTGDSALLLVRIMLDDDSPSSDSVDGYCDETCAEENGWGDDSARQSHFESSYGVLDITEDDGQLESITLSSDPGDYSGCDYVGLGNDALTELLQNDVNIFSFDMISFYMSRNINGCGFEGIAFVGGVYSWERNEWVGVLTHELGHSLSALHASTDEDNDGAVLCEYCDHSCVMGNSFTRHVTMNAPHRDYLGWIPASAEETVASGPCTDNCTTRYTIKDLQTDPSSLSGDEILLLKVPRTSYRTPSDEDSQVYFISYREGSTGLDSALGSDYADKVSVHHYASDGSNSYFVTALDAGDDFTDECNVLGSVLDFMSIDVVSIGDGEAVIDVTIGGDSSPSDCVNIIVRVKDSFGDGWNGNGLYLDSTRCLGAGLESGSSEDITICVPPGSYDPFVCGGDFDSEVSWTIFYSEDGKEKTLKGGAGSCSDDYGTFTATESVSSAGDDDDDADDDAIVDDDNTINVCFAADQMVETQNHGLIAISAVVVGDSVQVMKADGSLHFADVAFVPHATNEIPATFIEIFVKGKGLSLKVTPQHLLLAGDCGLEMNLRTAESLDVGHCVRTVRGEEEIVQVAEVRGKGLYTLVSTDSSGLVVVNGFVASSFGTAHAVPNFYYNIHRMLYKYLLPAWVMELEFTKQLNMFIGGAGIATALPFLTQTSSRNF